MLPLHLLERPHAAGQTKTAGVSVMTDQQVSITEKSYLLSQTKGQLPCEINYQQPRRAKADPIGVNVRRKSGIRACVAGTVPHAMAKAMLTPSRWHWPSYCFLQKCPLVAWLDTRTRISIWELKYFQHAFFLGEYEAFVLNCHLKSQYPKLQIPKRKSQCKFQRRTEKGRETLQHSRLHSYS